MRIYICSPYRADTPEGVERNVEFARRCCRVVLDAGQDPCAPHLFFTQFCDDNDEFERATCLEAGLRELQLCDGLIAFGETISEGMQNEIDFAENKGIPHYNAISTDHREMWNAQRYFKVCKELSEQRSAAEGRMHRSLQDWADPWREKLDRRERPQMEVIC